MRSHRPTLVQSCAPIFLFLTSFRRNASSSRMSMQELQSALRHEIDGVRSRCELDGALHPLFERALYPIVATADQVILSSAWPQRAGWSMNLLETHYFGRAIGGSEFFEHIKALLDDEPRRGSTEVAEVLFHCMALGFQGTLLGERTELERRRKQLFDKARLSRPSEGPLTAAAYGRNVDCGSPTPPTVRSLRLVALTIAALICMWIAGNTAMKITTHTEKLEIQGMLELLKEGPSGAG